MPASAISTAAEGIQKDIMPTPPQQEFPAAVTDIRLESSDPTRWRMTLTQTNFKAGDAGTLHAVSRNGTPIEVPVLAVIDDAGDIWHIVEKPLAAGTDVTGRITR
jgi:alanyl-tRNA synthetase